MKTSFLKLSIILLLLFLSISCQTKSFLHTKKNILNNYANFETFLNSKKISIDTIYLDKDNIKSIEVNKQEKIIQIHY